MKIRVVHFMRYLRPNVFSIERLYEDIRDALPPDCDAVQWVCANPSTGIIPRLRDAWKARKVQGDVNHVTGDTHYLTYFLDRSRTVITIHDLVSYDNATGLRRWVLWLLWFWLPVKRSQVVVTVSESTRQALLKAVRCNPSKVIVIHNPVSEEFQPFAKVFDFDCPRILQIGTNPNKNILRVAEALADIKCKLVIIGALNQELRKVLTKFQIDYENYVGLSRASLLVQYINSDMLIFVSTQEGFGLPIIEANAVGRPVLTSQLSPMTEVANGSAHTVNPFVVGSIRAGIEKIINDESYREQLIAAGYRNVRRFNLTVVAEKYASVYRRVSAKSCC